MTLSILRHPQADMASELRHLARDAERYGDNKDYYGQGGLITDFECDIATMFGKPAALMLPSGTVAQPMALKIYSQQRQGQTVLLHPSSHLLLHEAMGFEALWGLTGIHVGDAERVLTSADLKAVEPQQLQHAVALVIELPMREIGGQLPSWQDLQAQVAWARQHGLAVHIDGARLWQCPSYYQRDLAQIAALADSVYVSLYKDIGGIAGAVLLGENDFIAQAKVWSRRAGANLISLYPYILAAQRGLKDNLPYLPAAVAYARELANALATIDGVKINPNQVQCAMFHLHIAATVQQVESVRECYIASQDIEVLPRPRATVNGHSVCEITVGCNALSKPVEFWLAHMRACLARLG